MNTQFFLHMTHLQGLCCHLFTHRGDREHLCNYLTGDTSSLSEHYEHSIFSSLATLQEVFYSTTL
jgi:hypothetical protein